MLDKMIPAWDLYRRHKNTTREVNFSHQVENQLLTPSLKSLKKRKRKTEFDSFEIEFIYKIVIDPIPELNFGFFFSFFFPKRGK